MKIVDLTAQRLPDGALVRMITVCDIESQVAATLELMAMFPPKRTEVALFDSTEELKPLGNGLWLFKETIPGGANDE